MPPTLRPLSALAGIGAALALGSCETVLCAAGTYDRGYGACPADRYLIQVSLPVDRTDLRDSAARLQINVQAQAKDTGTSYDLLPGKDPTKQLSVQLSIDGVSYSMSGGQIQPGADKRSVSVSLPRQQDPAKPMGVAPEPTGALTAAVTLPDLDKAMTNGLHRIFRSPRFASPEIVTQTFNAAHAVNISARVAAKIVNPVGGPGNVLVTEETSPPGTVFRWLDLYAQTPSGTLGYANDGNWKSTSMNSQEFSTALLTLAKGAVVTYDVSKANKLAILPVGGTYQSIMNAQVPGDAQVLAACAEEAVVLLASVGAVRAFRIDPVAVTATMFDSVTTAGLPVIAVRDVLAAVPSQRSADYFGVIWEAGGKGTLLKLAKDLMGAPSAIPVGRDVTGVVRDAVSAAALADLDSDGLQDLIVTLGTDGSLLWSPQHPDGSFAAATSLGVTAAGATSISVGDIDGDQRPDLAVATSDKRLLIFRNQP